MPFHRDILHESINWGSTPKNLLAMASIIRDGEWYVPNVDDDRRMSWIELVTDFVTRHGFIGAMSQLTRKMKTYVTKLRLCNPAA